ncbi:MAG: hypothetical protein WCD18_28535 [Thermosynechococcaceae cyanobacterium]
MKILVLGTGLLSICLSGIQFSAQANPVPSFQRLAQTQQSFKLAQADESQMVATNRELLLKNRELARKIATKLGITSTGDVPTTGTPLEQNQVLILQNQETFKAIAEKVGATVPELSPVEGADTAEKNHNLLLQNRKIVRAILEKLGITPAAPPELTGSFVQKNHTLLMGNGAALGKIAEKLGV